jgi:hypothetical protein
LSSDAVEANDGSSKEIDRRSALKKAAVAAGAAGVVWAAPKVEGLSLRPAYASAGTQGPGNDFPPGGQNFTGNFGFSGNYNMVLGNHGSANFNLSTAFSGSGAPYTETVTLVSSPAGCSMLLVNFNAPTSADADGTWGPGVKNENANVAQQVFDVTSGNPSDPFGASASVTFHCL